MVNPWEPQSDSDVRADVRVETQYEDNPDELPKAELDRLLGRAKHRLHLRTGSTSWYSDSGMGMALIAYTAMRAKAAMENATIVDYSLGDQDVTLRNADPETSQQIQQWAEDVRIGLDASETDESPRMTMRNSTRYIGESHTHRR